MRIHYPSLIKRYASLAKYEPSEMDGFNRVELAYLRSITRDEMRWQTAREHLCVMEAVITRRIRGFLLAHRDDEFTLEQICVAVHAKKNSVISALARLQKNGLVAKRAYGRWGANRIQGEA